MEAGLHPSFLIGGEVNEIGTNAAWDAGEWIVVEADESDGTFLHLVPDIAIVTNVEADHLDHYGSFDAVRTAFAEFLASAGHRVVGSDDAEARAIGRAGGADLVGLGPDATHAMVAVATGRSSVAFDLMGPDGTLTAHLVVAVPGLHNAKNAAVATVAALAAGATPDAAVRALARFGGVARRFEFRGTLDGVTYVDDYAHLPTEVAAALAAARTGAWGRVVAVFQPHRYSRTAEVGEAFAVSFDDADVVVVTDVYGAGEAPVPGVSGRLVADAVRRARPDAEVHYVPGRTDLVAEVTALLRPGDLCLTLGAGDLTSLPDELMAGRRRRSRHRRRGGVSREADLAELAARLGPAATRGAPLGSRTTYRVGGTAALGVEPVDEAALLDVARALVGLDVPVLVVGNGSNLLVADAGFAGLVVVLGRGFDGLEIDGTEVRAGGALALPALARRTAAAGLTGLEWAVGVPGTVGGAVRMNAGGHGSDTVATLVAYRVVDLATATATDEPVEHLAASYRRTSVAPTEVVVEATHRLTRGDPAAGKAAIDEIVRWRRANQPGGANAGSVFTNPPGDSAGRLIDACGLKGLRIGTAQVSTKHANFIQADRGGSADDVRRVMDRVRAEVAAATGVVLTTEVRVVGFDDAGDP